MPEIKDKKKLKSFLISIFRNENVEFKSVSYVFCKDSYLLKLNQEYLNHNTLTDILTFTLSNNGSAIDAEIYISLERVRENAISFKISYQLELLRVMIHGILHLCNYSDRTPNKKALMREKENYYLSLLGFT
ncbi:MAG: rRNA maturation RNase YbeY [Ginsengibacter sp.]